jgi:hypothetical protein
VPQAGRTAATMTASRAGDHIHPGHGRSTGRRWIGDWRPDQPVSGAAGVACCKATSPRDFHGAMAREFRSCEASVSTLTCSADLTCPAVERRPVCSGTLRPAPCAGCTRNWPLELRPGCATGPVRAGPAGRHSWPPSPRSTIAAGLGSGRVVYPWDRRDARQLFPEQLGIEQRPLAGVTTRLRRIGEVELARHLERSRAGSRVRREASGSRRRRDPQG